jgi:hypothetical protein
MKLKALFAVVAVGLFVGFLAPVVLKLGNLALWSVVLAGAAMMLIDLWQSLR